MSCGCCNGTETPATPDHGEIPDPNPEAKKAAEQAGKDLEQKFATSYVDRELQCWIDSAKNDDTKQYRTHVASNVKELNELLNKQGHSGYSWKTVIKLLMRVADSKPICPLTGEEDEWGPTVTIGGKSWQANKRCPAITREPGKNETATNIDAYIVSDNGGYSWYSGSWAAKQFNYPVYITFPYTVPTSPKRIYIKYNRDVPIGEMAPDAAIDITGNEEEIKKTREEFAKKFVEER